MERTTILLSLLAGLIFAGLLPFSLLAWAVCFLVAAFSTFGLRKYSSRFLLGHPAKNLALLTLFIAGFSFAGVRVHLREVAKPINHIEHYPGTPVQFRAIVDRPPSESASRTQIPLKLVESDAPVGQPGSGKLLLVLNNIGADFQYGDLLRIEGKMTVYDNRTIDSYGAWLDRSGYSGIIFNPETQLILSGQGNPLLSWIFKIRAVCLERVYRLFPKPESALMAGVLFGDESQIPTDVEKAFQRTGTAHIIAISGMNFSVLVWVLLALLSIFPKRWWLPLSLIPFIVFYTIMTGAKAAIVRAAIMCAFALVAKSIGRTRSGVDSLLLSALLMGMHNPAILPDVGFQLSFFATLGILQFNGPLTALAVKMLPEKGKVQVLKALQEMLITTLSAQIFTTWIIAAAFRQFSLASLPANILIAPLQSFLMIGGWLAVFADFCSSRRDNYSTFVFPFPH